MQAVTWQAPEYAQNSVSEFKADVLDCLAWGLLKLFAKKLIL